MRVAACEALLEAIAAALDAGREVDAELFAVAKVAGSEFAWDSTDRLMQGLGSRGYDEANGVPQILRDARVTRIFEGASEPLLRLRRRGGARADFRPVSRAPRRAAARRPRPTRSARR